MTDPHSGHLGAKMEEIMRKAHIGEEGTEQFTVTTYVDGERIRVQKIHDPFIRNFTVTKISRWDHFKAIFRPRELKIQVSVDGSEGAQRAIMMLDPHALQRETEEILESRRISRETNGVMGYVEEKAR